MSFKISNSNQSLCNLFNKQVIDLRPQMKSNLSCTCQSEAFCDQVRHFYVHLETKQKNQDNDESTLGHNKIFDVRLQQT